jgi:putative transposase
MTYIPLFSWVVLANSRCYRRLCYRNGPFVGSGQYAVSQVVGFIKGKSAIHLARVYGEQRRNFVGQSFSARGYFVSTVGRDEEVIRNYIRSQEQEDQRLEQMNLWR